MRAFLSQHFWVFIFLFIGAFLVFLLVTSDTIVGVDTRFNAMRIEGLATHIANGGGYPCRLYFGACDGLGYAAPLFYCDFFIVPFALLRLIGVPLSVCLISIITCAVVLCGFFMWGVTRWMGMGQVEARLCAFLYMFSPPVMLLAFNSMQIGSPWGAAFIPCVLFPTIRLCGDKSLTRRTIMQSNLWIILGVSGMLLSHVITTYLAVLMMALICICRLPFLLRHLSRIVGFICAGVMVLLLTTWFWIPFLEQLPHTKLICFTIGTHIDTFVETQSSIVGLFLTESIARILTPLMGDWFFIAYDSATRLVGWTLLPFVFFLFVHRKGLLFPRPKSLYAGLLGVALVICALSASKMLLQLLEPVLGRVQFSTRFCVFLACAFVPFMVWYMVHLFTRRESRVIILGSCIALVVALSIPVGHHFNAYVTGTRERLSKVPRPYSVGMGEYIPVAGKEMIEAKSLMGFSHILSEQTLSLPLATPSKTVVVEKFYYYGYAAELDGQPCRVRESANGLLEIETEGRTGELRVWYAGTPLQRISTWISLVALVLLLGGLVAFRRKIFGEELPSEKKEYS